MYWCWLLVSPSPCYPLSGDQRLGDTSHQPDLTHKDESGQLGGTSPAPLTTHQHSNEPCKIIQGLRFNHKRKSVSCLPSICKNIFLSLYYLDSKLVNVSTWWRNLRRSPVLRSVIPRAAVPSLQPSVNLLWRGSSWDPLIEIGWSNSIFHSAISIKKGFTWK